MPEDLETAGSGVAVGETGDPCRAFRSRAQTGISARGRGRTDSRNNSIRNRTSRRVSVSYVVSAAGAGKEQAVAVVEGIRDRRAEDVRGHRAEGARELARSRPDAAAQGMRRTLTPDRARRG